MLGSWKRFDACALAVKRRQISEYDKAFLYGVQNFSSSTI